MLISIDLLPGYCALVNGSWRHAVNADVCRMHVSLLSFPNQQPIFRHSTRPYSKVDCPVVIVTNIHSATNIYLKIIFSVHVFCVVDTECLPLSILEIIKFSLVHCPLIIWNHSTSWQTGPKIGTISTGLMRYSMMSPESVPTTLIIVPVNSNCFFDDFGAFTKK